MIQRFQLSTSRKTSILVGQLFVTFIFAGFLALCISESHLLGIAIFGTFSFCFLRILVLLFVRGDIHEAYLLSDQTLAILHPRRKTRVVGIHQIVTYYPRVPSFGLEDGTSVGLHCPDLNLKLPDLLVRRWYSEACLNDCLAANAATVRLPDPLYLVRTVLLGSLIVAAILSGVAETWLVMLVALVGALVIVFAETTWGVYRSRRFAYPLCRERSSSNDTHMERFPKSPPRLLHYLSPYVLLTLFFVLIILPANTYTLRRVPPEDGSFLFVAITALFALPLGGVLIHRIYRNLVRGELFATILVSPRTLAVVHPHKPVRYIKHGDCIAYLPGRKRLLLEDRSHVDFIHPSERRDAPMPMAYLWRNWWSFVPEERRAGVYVSLKREDHITERVERRRNTWESCPPFQDSDRRHS